MKVVLVFCWFLLPLAFFAQQNFIHQADFYKDQSSRYSSNFFPSGQYPKNESEFNLIAAINDSSKQYYELTEILFKKHLFELVGDNYSLNISPIFDFTFGKDLSDTSNRNLYQNTRGVFVEGDLGAKFSFATEFHENQGRYTDYQTSFYSDHGELYSTVSGYTQQNAVVPGKARTKPFKEDGFDYAYAFGYLAYKPIETILISGGNSTHFIGEGYHSLLLGNSNGFAPYLKIDWQLSSKFSVTFMKARHLNLLRRVATSSAESYYEQKGFTMNYLTYQPVQGVGVSLFEGTQWSRGDSIQSFTSPIESYIPIPFIGPTLNRDESLRNSTWGINLIVNRLKNHVVYGQLAIDNMTFNDCAVQAGIKGFDYFGLTNLMIQVEYNYIPESFYSVSQNSRLNYSHYNMPLAHIMGNNFSELLIRANYEWKRIYTNILFDYSDRGSQNGTSLLAFDIIDNATPKKSVFTSSLEIGYRVNRKMNLCVFGQFLIRTDNTSERQTSLASFGLRTAISNNPFVF